MHLNNRETAALLWICFFVLVVVCMPATRRSIPPVIRSLKPKIVIPLLLMTTYVVISVGAAHHWGIWGWELITPTVVWFVTAAVLLYFDLNKALGTPCYFRRVVIKSVSIPVLITAVLNLYPFSLGTEIVIQGLLILFSAMSVVAARESPPAKKFCDTVLVVIGAGIVLHAVVGVVNDWERQELGSLLTELILPPILTAVLIPFLYVFTLTAAYEARYTRMRVFRREGRPIAGLAAVAVRSAFSIQKAQHIGSSADWELGRASGLKEALALIDQGIAQEQTRLAEEEAQNQALLTNAGSDAVDESGRRMDQREFKETRDALQYLALCHAGHYRRLGSYRSDLLDLLGPETFLRKGLPVGATIHMHVGADGQTWWAWRRTITGWVFGIGAGGPPPSQWEYDGPDAPTSPPGPDTNWRNALLPKVGPDN